MKLSARRGAVAVGSALLLLTGALALADYLSLAMLTLPQPTIDVSVPRARVVRARPVTQRRPLLVILVDGLGADAAAAQPELAALVRRGASVDLEAEPPTFSSPQYVAFLTGVGPFDSGVRTNLRLARTPLDSVMDAVRADGGFAVEVGDAVDWWGRLFVWDQALLVPGARLVDEAARLLADPGNQLVLVHIAGVDAAGHATGAASPGYRDAAAVAARQVAALAAVWGERGPMVVLSDHGHMPRGGHGGSQPDVRRAFFVVVGPGVQPGARAGAARSADVAPTLAALLGVGAPAEAEGRTMVGLLAADAQTVRTLVAADQRRVVEVQARMVVGRKTLAASERQGQFVRGGAVLVALALAVARRLSPAAWRGLLLGALAMALTAGAVLFVVGGASFSAFRSDSNLGVATAITGLLAGLAVLAKTLRTALRGQLAPSEAWRLSLGFALGASPPAAAAFVVAGIATPRFSCRPDWLAAGPTLAYAAFGSVVIAAAAVSLLAAARSRR